MNSPFPTVFPTVSKNSVPFSSNLRLLSANSFNFKVSKICCLRKGYVKNSSKKVNNRVKNILMVPYFCCMGFPFDTYPNSLPNNKILAWSKLKAFVDDKINMTQKLKFVLERIENIVEKGENAG